MKLTLYRKWWTEKSTIGELHVNGAFFCFTLEDRLRHGAKVKHETAIPGGKYEVAITMSARFGRLMPLLVHVPGFEGIRIHAGNAAKDTSGCILVGRRRGTDSISESRSAYDELYQLLVKAINKEKIEIEILNPSDWVMGQDGHAANGRERVAQPLSFTAPPDRTAGGPLSSIVPLANGERGPELFIPHHTPEIPARPQAESGVGVQAVAQSTARAVPVRLIARLLPLSSPVLAGAASWFVQYRWPLLCVAVAVVSFWLGWLTHSPFIERKQS